MTKKKDLREEAQQVMGADDEIPFDEVQPAATPAAEPEEESAESVTEYYLFPRDVFYGKAPADGQGGGELEGVVGQSINDTPIESKADVLKFLRSAEPGTYVLVKVMDELTVKPPKEANIVSSNPRTKKPRKDGGA